jgi:hypothetical protein
MVYGSRKMKVFGLQDATTEERGFETLDPCKSDMFKYFQLSS